MPDRWNMPSGTQIALPRQPIVTAYISRPTRAPSLLAWKQLETSAASPMLTICATLPSRALASLLFGLSTLAKTIVSAGIRLAPC